MIHSFPTRRDSDLIATKVLEELQRFGEIRYDNGQFWQWNGSCFHQLDKDFLYLYVANNVTDSPIVRRDSDYRAVVNVLQRMCKGMLVQGDDRGINFANGFVGEDLFVTDHDPKYGATFTLPFEYNRDAASQCPKRSEEHTSELQSLMRISYAVFCLKKKKNK